MSGQLVISEHLHCFVANSFLLQFTLFLHIFWGSKLRSRNTFDKYDVCIQYRMLNCTHILTTKKNILVRNYVNINLVALVAMVALVALVAKSERDTFTWIFFLNALVALVAMVAFGCQ